MWWKTVAVAMLFVLAVSCSSEDGEGSASTTEQTSTPAAVEVAVSTGDEETLTQEQETSAVQSIKEIADVQDVRVERAQVTNNRLRSGTTLQLIVTIVVDVGTTADRGQELGNQLVRFFMNFGPENDPAPGEDLGEGLFEYKIMVVDPDGKFVTRGSKSPIAPIIYWT